MASVPDASAGRLGSRTTCSRHRRWRSVRRDNPAGSSRPLPLCMDLWTKPRLRIFLAVIGRAAVRHGATRMSRSGTSCRRLTLRPHISNRTHSSASRTLLAGSYVRIRTEGMGRRSTGLRNRCEVLAARRWSGRPGRCCGRFRVRLGKALPPTRVTRRPAEFALGFRVGGATGFGSEHDAGLAGKQPREPDGDVAWRLGSERVREHWEPFAHWGGLVVDDVVDRRASCSSASTVAAAASSRWMNEETPPPSPTIGNCRLRTGPSSPSLGAP
jgi:hypothetical protein